MSQAGLEIRGAIHIGECEKRGDGFSGLAIQLTASLLAHARPGDIVASRTVRELEAGALTVGEDAGVPPHGQLGDLVGRHARRRRALHVHAHAGQVGFAQRQFRLGLDDGQRGLELVRGVGEEALASLQHALQARHVLVHGSYQRAGLHGQRGIADGRQVVGAARGHGVGQALQGPQAVTALERVISGVSALVFMQGALFRWQGHDLWISRSGYTGEDGFEISAPATAAEALADALTAQGEVKPIGLGARDSLRLEADLPLYGHDLDPETTPVAAQLGFAIKKRRREEGGFPGHARIMIEREQGPIVKRVGLIVDGRQPVREGAAVVDADGTEVGRVTSGGFAPSVQKPIAMAYVPAAMAEPGTRITLAQRGKIHSAEVVKMPFVPHRYVRKGA